jgi:mono/diheme cytochrome c family protein
MSGPFERGNRAGAFPVNFVKFAVEVDDQARIVSADPPVMFRFIVLPPTVLVALMLPLLAAVGVGESLKPEDLKFFETRIRPLLSENCYKCHAENSKKIKGGLLLDRKAGWMKGGDSGEVIVPGKPDESLLIEMVERDPEVEAMPPKTALKPKQVADLREWVKRGAPDPRTEALGAETLGAKTFDLEERKKWWSLQPVAKVTVPRVKAQEWPANEVDHFILAELEERKWDPAPRARKEHLLRRVALSLTGLAPTEEELRAFLADESVDAYVKVVDDLLASPRFGERWARHWMDVVRFAETKAFEADYTMPYVDRYRDYLIRAFNDDVPFDQFVLEALAGDRLEIPRLHKETGSNESVVGSGYLYLNDGQHGPPDIHSDEARIFDSMIKVTGTAFQGLTVNCAKCHDHKFDAITAADYYSFYGMLRSSRLHYANTAPPVKKAEVSGRLKTAKRELMAAVFSAVESEAEQLPKVFAVIKALEGSPGHHERLKALRAPLKKGEKQDARETAFRKASEGELAELVERAGVEVGLAMKWFGWMHAKDVAPELEVLKGVLTGGEANDLKNQANREERSNEAFSFGLSGNSFGEWIASGPGFQVADNDGYVPAMSGDQVVRAAIGTGAATGVLSSRLEGVIRSPDFILDGGAVDLWVRGRQAAVKLVVRNYELAGKGPTTGRLRVGVNSDRWRKISFGTHLWKGEPAYLEIQHQGAGMVCMGRNGRSPAPAEDAWVAVACGRLPQWGKVWLGAAAGEDRGRDVSQIIAAMAAGGRKGLLSPAQREVLGVLLQSGLMQPDLQRHSGIKGKLESFRRIAAELPPPVYVRSVVDGVPTDQPIFVRGDHKNISKSANPRHFLDGLDGEELVDGGSGRLAWAQKVASPDNPLTARVRVNRIWSRIFGTGLHASVDDFGKMGGEPTHPELLDYLARDFVANDWSTKKLVRKLVLSSTFRTSSTPGPGMATADPKNEYLQHMPVGRMDAESIRDHILACSGQLKRDEMYGPSIPVNIDDQPNSRAKPSSGPVDGKGRRSIYLEMRRNYLSSFLRVFDLPNATEPAGKRNSTNVPAQSLALMNDRFVHEQSVAWAQRVLGRKGTTEERLGMLHEQAFGRDATEAELEWGSKALKELGPEDSAEAWAAFCHLMINRKEFIYVF